MRSLKDAAVAHALGLQRMFFHVAACVMTGATYLLAQPTQHEAIVILAPFTIIFVLIDVSRLIIPAWGRFCAQRYMGIFMRTEELHFPSALTFAVLGIFCTVWWFPREIAAVAILFVGIIDPIARLVGVLWGEMHLTPFNKTVEGTCGGMIAGLCIALWFALQGLVALSFKTLVSGSMSASVIEVIGGRVDNLFIPIGSAFIMTQML